MEYDYYGVKYCYCKGKIARVKKKTLHMIVENKK